MILKCKSCGGQLEGNAASTILTCPFCGMKQTLPMINSDKANIALLERAFLFLEDGEFERADQYFDKVLDSEPTNAYAYLGRLMFDFRVRNQEELKNVSKSFENNDNYNKVLRFGNEELSSVLQQYISIIEERLEENNRQSIYDKALDLVNSDSVDSVKDGISKFESIGNYKDSKEQIKKAQSAIVDLEKQKAKNKKLIIVFCVAIVLMIVVGFAVAKINENINYKKANEVYENAVALMNQENYEEASKLFEQNLQFKDSQKLYDECMKALKIQDMENARAKYNLDQTVGSKYVKSDGTVFDGSPKWTDIVSITGGYGHFIGLKSDGTIEIEQNRIMNHSVDATDIIAVESGDYFAIGLKLDGTVVELIAYGSDHGIVNETTENWSDIVDIDVSENTAVGLKSDGTVVCCGKYTYDEVEEWTDIVDVAVGYHHIVGLKSDGTVVACGSDEFNACDVSQWTDIVSVSAGEFNTYGLKADGTVVAVGLNRGGECEVSTWTDIVYLQGSIGLKSDGTAVIASNNSSVIKNIESMTDIKIPA